MREASVHLKDIVAAMEAIQGFNVPDTVKKRYPEIPWKEMAGMRDRLIRSYFAQESKPPRYNGENLRFSILGVSVQVRTNDVGRSTD